ncbi:MAG: Prolyl-tRNA synthetase, partial [Berkelbacteria bacterium GW2011_GWB1_38_5]
MRYSKSLIKTLKETPKGVTSTNQALLERGSFIYQVGSGIFAYMPLGFLVFEKIRKIIIDELNKIGCQEVSLPILHPSELWKTSGRFSEIGPELLKVNTDKEAEFVLAMTHEEVITPLAKSKIQSFTDLPFCLNQISKKIRFEARPRGGLIRLREFTMQDAYSFHANQKQLDETFETFIDAYKKIFEKIGLEVIIVQADSGIMGGSDSMEFMALSEVGEDTVLICPKCQKAFNLETKEDKKCPDDGEDLKIEKAIEMAHVFNLGTKYSDSFLCSYSLITANVAIKRSTFEAAKGFDTGMRRFEDTELGIRLWEMNCRFSYRQDARGYHLFFTGQSDRGLASGEYFGFFYRHPYQTVLVFL